MLNSMYVENRLQEEMNKTNYTVCKFKGFMRTTTIRYAFSTYLILRKASLVPQTTDIST